MTNKEKKLHESLILLFNILLKKNGASNFTGLNSIYSELVDLSFQPDSPHETLVAIVKIAKSRMEPQTRRQSQQRSFLNIIPRAGRHDHVDFLYKRLSAIPTDEDKILTAAIQLKSLTKKLERICFIDEDDESLYLLDDVQVRDGLFHYTKIMQQLTIKEKQAARKTTEKLGKLTEQECKRFNKITEKIDAYERQLLQQLRTISDDTNVNINIYTAAEKCLGIKNLTLEEKVVVRQFAIALVSNIIMLRHRFSMKRGNFSNAKNYLDQKTLQGFWVKVLEQYFNNSSKTFKIQFQEKVFSHPHKRFEEDWKLYKDALVQPEYHEPVACSSSYVFQNKAAQPSIAASSGSESSSILRQSENKSEERKKVQWKNSESKPDNSKKSCASSETPSAHNRNNSPRKF